MVAEAIGDGPWGCSSAGRAPALQAGGRRFEPDHLHQIRRLHQIGPFGWAGLDRMGLRSVAGKRFGSGPLKGLGLDVGGSGDGPDLRSLSG